MEKLHIILFPVMAHGHMIPMLDMAKLFISRGLKATIISTPEFSDPIKKARDSGLDIGLSIIKFPPQGSELPDHITSFEKITTYDLVSEFLKSLSLLQEPVERLLQEIKPSAIISDTFFSWTVDSAAKFGIPRLVFHGTSNFALCAEEQMELHKPYKNLTSDSDTFVLHGLPHELTFVKSQMPRYLLEENEHGFTKFFEKVRKSNSRSYGVIVNSFYELESQYANHYRKDLGRKSWLIGPLFLSNQGEVEKNVERGKKSTIDAHECLEWLDSKMPNSVVYMCFGSMVIFTPAQLHEIAIGLEASGQDFIWVVRESGENEDWLPYGFEERTNGKGLIIRGWAPQIMILDHEAVGAFVTHCGWNSTLEGVCAGVPMVTWPLYAEQFYNEKLVVEILRMGVSVGNKTWRRVPSEGVSSEAVAKAVKDVVLGEEASEMRNCAEKYKEMAKISMNESGSSYNGLSDLIEELSVYSHPQGAQK